MVGIIKYVGTDAWGDNIYCCCSHDHKRSHVRKHDHGPFRWFEMKNSGFTEQTKCFSVKSLSISTNFQSDHLITRVFYLSFDICSWCVGDVGLLSRTTQFLMWPVPVLASLNIQGEYLFAAKLKLIKKKRGDKECLHLCLCGCCWRLPADRQRRRRRRWQQVRTSAVALRLSSFRGRLSYRIKDQNTDCQTEVKRISMPLCSVFIFIKCISAALCRSNPVENTQQQLQQCVSGGGVYRTTICLLAGLSSTQLASNYKKWLNVSAYAWLCCADALYTQQTWENTHTASVLLGRKLTFFILQNSQLTVVCSVLYPSAIWLYWAGNICQCCWHRNSVWWSHLFFKLSLQSKKKKKNTHTVSCTF